jgi:Gram-negative bacterial TonB protein C-terminal
MTNKVTRIIQKRSRIIRAELRCKMRKLLPMLLLVAIGNAGSQIAPHERDHTRDFQSQKSDGNHEESKKEQRPRDLRLEHADVPMYPQLARTARIFGNVQVQVTVKDGKVVSTEVKSGHPVLASATVENIQTWRFYSLVNATFTTKFTYQLETKEPLDSQNPKVELQLPLLVKITAVPVTLDSQKDPSTKRRVHSDSTQNASQ